MSSLPTEQDGRASLREHLLRKAAAARARHGPTVDAQAIVRILEDRELVRYPVLLRFERGMLEPGEFAHAVQSGAHPREGFVLHVHPAFTHRHDVWPALIAYHLPPINYGDIVSPEDCEAFGAALLGLEVDTYYSSLCELADSLGPA